MNNIEYSPYGETKGDVLSQELKELIIKEDPHFDEIDYAIFKIITVPSPFILADNKFDLREANNNTIEIGVNRVKSVSFTGGSFYSVYEKVSDDAYIVHGNDEEGYNIFNLV